MKKKSAETSTFNGLQMCKIDFISTIRKIANELYLFYFFRFELFKLIPLSVQKNMSDETYGWAA